MRGQIRVCTKCNDENSDYRNSDVDLATMIFCFSAKADYCY